jgi:hypothetical protein
VVAGAVLAGCGGSGGSSPDPTVTPDPPVSVSVKALDTYAQDTDGIVALWVYTNGTHAPSAQVTVAFDVPAGKSLKVRYEPSRDAGWDKWPTLKLARSAGAGTGLDTLTGSYTVPLKGGDIWRLYLDPQFGPSGADDAVPVHATLSAAGRTLATDSTDASLAALTVAGKVTGPLTLHRGGRWTEAAYTVHNTSTRDMAQVNAGFQANECDEDDVTGCDPTGPNLVGALTVQVNTGHGWVPAAPSNGVADRVLSTPLKAGATARVRVRFAPTADLAKNVTRADVSLTAAGELPGAKRSSSDSDAEIFDVGR